MLASFVNALGGLRAGSPAELVAQAAPGMRERVEDQVDDPIGRDAAAYQACAERLDRLVTTLVGALAKAVRAGRGRRGAW